jgi:tripartite-type tricarboxylate transporter receptor subunit TctC
MDLRLSGRPLLHFVAAGVVLLVAAWAFAAAAPARAQNYPTRPVRVVVPFAAGGLGDISTRLVADKLGERLHERFVIDNQPGAGGITAARSVLAGASDGYTLALLTNGTAISVPLFKNLPFDPVRDFTAVSGLSAAELSFATNAAGPYATLGDVLKAARAAPGKLNIATVTVGSTQNLAAELLRISAGIDIAIIPYRTTPDTVVALLRDDVQLVIDFYAALKGPIDDGKLRLVATSGPGRARYAPAVPSVAEAGVPGYEVVTWNALYAKSRTAPAIISKLNATVREVMALPDLRSRMLELGLEPLAGAPQESAARLSADIVKWRKVIEDAHIPKL